MDHLAGLKAPVARSGDIRVHQVSGKLEQLHGFKIGDGDP